MNNRNGSRCYYPGLDGLKVLAAALIVFHHYQQLTGVVFSGVNFYPADPNTDFSFGQLIILYFMISGFLTAEAQARSAARPPVAQFGHRCLRLYPMAVIACAAYLCLSAGLRLLLGHWVWYAGGGGLWTTLCSFLLNYDWGIWSLSELPANSPLWYLSVLIEAYAVFYLLVWLGRRVRVRWQWLCAAFFLLVCAVYGQGLSLPFLSSQGCVGMAPFFAGVLLAWAAPRVGRMAGGLWLAVSLGTLCLLLGGTGTLVEKYWLQLFVVYPGILLAALRLPRGRAPRLERAVRFAGATSFAVYLWHCPLFVLRVLLLELLPLSVAPGPAEMLLFTLAVELAAIPLHLYVERPIARRIAAWEGRNTP